jgi:hypothetical protein
MGGSIMFVSFNLRGKSLHIYVTINKKAAESFQKGDVYERRWYYLRYGIHDFIILSQKQQLSIDINVVYDYNELVEMLQKYHTENEKKILNVLLHEINVKNVQAYIDDVKRRMEERKARKKSVIITCVENEHIQKLIERQGRSLDDEEAIIYYEAKERYIFYHYWSRVAIFIPKEKPAVENFVQALQEFVKTESDRKTIIDILEEMRKIPQFEDYAIAGLMVMD